MGLGQAPAPLARSALWHRIPAEEGAEAQVESYDVAVIGGGIIGCSAANHLTAAGFRTILMERGDIGGATSGRTSRLQYCGLSYFSRFRSVPGALAHPLESWESVELARRAMRDRSAFVRDTPERVRPITFYFPLHRDASEPLWKVRAGFALLERLDGRRSVFAASGDYVDFGRSPADRFNPDGTLTHTNVHDNFFRVEGSFTYRPLRVVSEFSLRIGVVRGNSPVPLDDSQAPGKIGTDRFKVGLNYGAPTVRFRLADMWHLEAEFLTSVTETGFSVGTGSALLIGDPYGTKLTLGFESIQVFGTRFWSRMDVAAGNRFTIAPLIEVTNMPHANDYGVRLIGEVTADLGAGFHTSVRGGYQARRSTEGGPSAGATVAYSF